MLFKTIMYIINIEEINDNKNSFQKRFITLYMILLEFQVQRGVVKFSLPRGRLREGGYGPFLE